MSKVFAVQNQLRMNRITNELEPKFDLSSASKYGAIEYLLSPTARPFNSEHVVGVLREKLASFCDADHLLLVGNPCLIGFAVAIAADYNYGRVNVLQWDGVRSEYIRVAANLRFAEEKRWRDTWTEVGESGEIENLLVDALEQELENYQDSPKSWAAVTAVLNGLRSRDAEIEKLRTELRVKRAEAGSGSCRIASDETANEYYCTREAGHNGPCAAVPRR